MKIKLCLPKRALAAASILAVAVPSLTLGQALPINPENTVTATMDNGTVKTGNTWYEVGVNTAAPLTGLKTGLVTSLADTNSSYLFMPATGLNVIMLDANTTTWTIDFATPTPVYALSFAGGTGNGGTAPKTVLWITFTNGAVERVGPILFGDWFNNTPILQNVNGRMDLDGNSYNNVTTPPSPTSGNPRVLAVNTNLPAGSETNAISSITLTWTEASPTANSHTMIFAVSGDTNGAGHFTPIPLTADSFNQNGIVGVANASQNAYVQANLVGDISAIKATVIDTNLVNPWGIAASATGPFWVTDNGSGLATVYNSTGGVQTTVVEIPTPTGATSPAAPTGIVFNGNTNDFLIPVSGSSVPAQFIFATEQGIIAAWNSGSSASVAVDNSAASAVYYGLALVSLAQGTNASSNYLYAANFNSGKIEVYNSAFTQVTSGFPLTTSGTPFTDTNLPAGYAPVNIAAIGTNMLVAYAQQNPTNPLFSVAGAGKGYLDVFTPSGVLLKQLITTTNGPLNSPWGIALAPASFGPFGGALLVGNYGDGHINAFDPALGTYLGQLLGTSEKPLAISGLSGLMAGNGGNGGAASSLYFTAGIMSNGVSSHGLLGSLTFPANAVAAPYDLLQTVHGYQDNFEAATRNTNWVAVGPGGDHYVQTKNVLQGSTSVGDPNHLLFMGAGASNNVQEILARMRIVAFGTGDPCRGGVALGVNTNIVSGNATAWSGYNIQFRDYTSEASVRHNRLLDDLRSWGPTDLDNAWANDTWYWLRLRMDPKADGVNDVFGKVWAADGVTPEPSAWQMVWADSSAATQTGGLHHGWPAITGCSNEGLSQYEVDYALIKCSGLPSIQVAFDVAPVGPIPPVIQSLDLIGEGFDYVINWFGGKLETATSVTNGATFTALPASTAYNSPYTNTTSGEMKFFRISK